MKGILAALVVVLLAGCTTAEVVEDEPSESPYPKPIFVVRWVHEGREEVDFSSDWIAANDEAISYAATLRPPPCLAKWSRVYCPVGTWDAWYSGFYAFRRAMAARGWRIRQARPASTVNEPFDEAVKRVAVTTEILRPIYERDRWIHDEKDEHDFYRDRALCSRGAVLHVLGLPLPPCTVRESETYCSGPRAANWSVTGSDKYRSCMEGYGWRVVGMYEGFR